MEEIKRIGICSAGKGVFNTDYAYVETDKGRLLVYYRPQDEVDGSWDEYVSAVKSDFEYAQQDELNDMFEPFESGVHWYHK